MRKYKQVKEKRSSIHWTSGKRSRTAPPRLWRKQERSLSVCPLTDIYLKRVSRYMVLFSLPKVVSMKLNRDNGDLL